MNPDAVFRMSVINALVEIHDCLETVPGITIAQASGMLSRGVVAKSGFDYRGAVAILKEFPELGKALQPERQIRLRVLLRELIVALKPSWSMLIPNGREYLASYIRETDVIQCLRCAGLYGDSSDKSIRKWWDDTASLTRSIGDESRLAVGREGELRSLEFERRRLAMLGLDNQPKWMSVEDNTLGYDIRSFDYIDGLVVPLFIEVKATTSHSHFFITRNEWEKAIKFGDRFLLHLWTLKDDELDCLRISELAIHLPIDRGKGRWQNIEITLA